VRTRGVSCIVLQCC